MAAPQISYDVDGSNAISSVLTTLMNQFPGLGTRNILFSTMDNTAAGIGFFPTSGAAILSETEDITGHVTQMCLYPFTIVYRSSPKTDAQRIKIKEFLDALVRWLCREPVTIGQNTHTLSAYPALTVGNRVIKAISQTGPAHLNGAYADGVEDWTISGTLRYEHQFDK